jgi:hypothetical protein
MPVRPVDVPLSGSGIATWVLGALGGVVFLLGFVLHPLLIFAGIGFLVAALVASAVSDRASDAKARALAAQEAARVTRCAKCRTGLGFDGTTGRWFCPSCRTYV